MYVLRLLFGEDCVMSLLLLLLPRPNLAVGKISKNGVLSVCVAVHLSKSRIGGSQGKVDAGGGGEE